MNTKIISDETMKEAIRFGTKKPSRTLSNSIIVGNAEVEDLIRIYQQKSRRFNAKSTAYGRQKAAETAQLLTELLELRKGIRVEGIVH